MVHPVNDWPSPPLTFTPTGKVTQALRNFYNGASKLKDRGWPTTAWAMLVPTDSTLNSNPIGNFRAMVDLGGRVNFNWEQAPNDANLVALGTTRERLGDPQLDLTWSMKDIDWGTLDWAAELTGQALEKAGYATNCSYTRPGIDQLLMGDHPMGTTRMSLAPDRGVVNPGCQVHDVPNLYVASSSVFPLGGWSNPTLTIVALAARLADDITGP
jgi:choline dehydrogenase-like flavoprotein